MCFKVQFCYRCKNHKCVPKSNVCDGVDNCGDGSDEEAHACKFTFLVCFYNFFKETKIFFSVEKKLDHYEKVQKSTFKFWDIQGDINLTFFFNEQYSNIVY